MKLQGISIVFILCVMNLTRMVGGLCMVRNTNEAGVYCYQCFKSDNYLSDVGAAPVDIPRISFTDANMQTLRNKSFARLSAGLEQLNIYFSKIGNIEDNAFESLGKLRSLEIEGNNIQTVKGAWFKSLSKLDRISLKNNGIKSIESSFFGTVPPLKKLSISQNNLNYLPVASFENFRTEEFYANDNPLSLVTLASLLAWLNDNDVQYGPAKQSSMNDPLESMLYVCVEESSKSSLDEDLLDKCIRKKLDFSPTEDQYTVSQVCQFLNGEPSPFINCTLFPN